MKEKVFYLLAGILPLIAIAGVYIWRVPNDQKTSAKDFTSARAPHSSVKANAVSSASIMKDGANSLNDSDFYRQMVEQAEQSKRRLREAKMRLVEASPPEVIRQNHIKGMRDREPQFRELMISLGIPHSVGEEVLQVLLERNIQLNEVNIDAAKESDRNLSSLLYTGKDAIRKQTFEKLVKLVGRDNADAISQLDMKIDAENIARARKARYGEN